MKHHSKLDHFGEDRAKSYDQNNRYLLPITENLHYLIQILFNELSPGSSILCVGAGTGTEIIGLARAFPGFSFVAVEPSESMFRVCLEKLESESLLERCRLVNGWVHDLKENEKFDAAICLLVLHHTDKEERQKIVSGISERLNPHGCFVCAEISYDAHSGTANDQMEKWKSLNRLSGASEEKLKMLHKMMEDHLFIQSPEEIEAMLEASGFPSPVQFFQSFLIRAWYVRRSIIEKSLT